MNTNTVTINQTAVNDMVASASHQQRIINETFVRNALDMGGIKFALIPVSQMAVDMEYQRAPQNKINKIAREWDISKCGVIKVSYRDGVFYIIDGQNRYLAAKTIGVESLPCQIHINLIEENEAKIFAEQDNGKTRLSTFNKFQAELAAKNESTLMIYEICIKYNILSEKKPIKSVCGLKGLDAVQRIYNNYGSDALEWVFDIIKNGGWHNVKGGYADCILVSLCNIYQTNKNNLSVVKSAIIKMFEKTTPDYIIAQGTINFIGRGKTAALTAFLEAYIKSAGENLFYIN